MEEKEKYFQEIYQKFSPMIYRFLRQRLPEEDALDILQNTFEKFLYELKKGKNFRGKEKAWLFQVSYNLFVDFLRKEKRHLSIEERREIHTSSPPISSEELRKIFTQVAYRMDPKGRYLLLLDALLEKKLSQKEIGEILGKSDRTIRRMIKKLFYEIEKELKKRGIDESFITS